mgnify:CR=1 FL=1
MRLNIYAVKSYKDKMYIGTMVQGRQKVISYKVHDKVATSEDEWYEVPDTHEPILEQAVFNRAQELLQRAAMYIICALLISGSQRINAQSTP